MTVLIAFAGFCERNFQINVKNILSYYVLNALFNKINNILFVSGNIIF